MAKRKRGKITPLGVHRQAQARQAKTSLTPGRCTMPRPRKGNAYQRVMPKRNGKAPTLRELGRRWTSGELALEHPDHVKEKRNAGNDVSRLERYVYPSPGTCRSTDSRSTMRNSSFFDGASLRITEGNGMPIRAATSDPPMAPCAARCSSRARGTRRGPQNAERILLSLYTSHMKKQLWVQWL